MAKTTMDADGAQAISLKALAFLAEDPGRFQRFINLTGVKPQAVASLVRETQFQVAVLEHLLGDERLLVEFCTAERLAPTLPSAALQILDPSLG
ncbi:MAG TPA: DUF3572 family protein [Aestuariivirgaceae bacterium]|jgi:hypothetical protein